MPWQDVPWVFSVPHMDSPVKNLPAMQETLGWEDPLEKGNDYPLQYS